MNRRRISWSELPPELLLAIAGRLATRSDILQFRAVCQTWRCSVAFSLLSRKNILSPLLPHKISTTTPPLLNSKSISPKMWREISGNSLILAASSVFLLRSAAIPELPPWLITVEEFNPGKLYPRQPLSGINVENFPEKTLHLSDFRVSKLGSFCTLRFADNPREMFRRKFWRDCSYKVVLFANPGRRITPISINDCTAVVLYNNGTVSAIRLKNEEERHVNFKGRKFDDILSFGGKIYAIDRKGRLYTMTYGSLNLCQLIDEPLSEGSRHERKKRLFELGDELYLVDRTESYNSLGFDIYRLNDERTEWDVVDGLGHSNILFVTSDGCFIASSNDLPGWRGNCVVFYRDTFPQYNGPSFDFTFFKHAYEYFPDEEGEWNGELNVLVCHLEGGYNWSVATY